MMSRTIFSTMGWGRSARMMVSVIGDLGAPRMSLTASFSDMPLVGVSSILMMRSPAITPARGGRVLDGEMTLTKPSSAPTSMPRPPNSPCVAVCISRKASASR